MELIQLNNFPIQENNQSESNYKGYLKSIEDLALSFNEGEFIVFGGRPNSAKTEILLNVLEIRNKVRNEKALFISFNELPHRQFDEIQLALKGSGNEKQIIICLEVISNYTQAIELIEIAMAEHSIECIYIDDIYYFELYEEEDEIEMIDEHFCYSCRNIRESRKFFSFLVELNKTSLINIVTTTPLLRSVEERGGDRRPHLIDFYTGTLELVATKIILLHRPEIYGFLCDEHGESTENIVEVSILLNRFSPSNYQFNYMLKSYDEI